LSKVDRRIHSDGAAFRRAQWRPHFKFNEAVSFQIPVETQAEIERLTNALSAVPEAEQCGWVKDRYGLSWQICRASFRPYSATPICAAPSAPSSR
jgi:predicted 3-demethylubiquinone-9 3-methyltransferase (glyoxalase superfamily)